MTRFLKPMTRGMCIAFVLLTSLTLTNCSKDDDNPPEEYEFGQEFEDIGDLPDLEDEDPEFTEPDLGAVEESEATTNAVADLQDGGDLSAETQASVNAVADFSQDFSAAVETESANLSDDRIEEIMNASELDADLSALADDLENVPDEVAALLPNMTFIFPTETAGMAMARSFTGGDLDLTKIRTVAQAQEGPCFDAAKAAYDDAMEEPIQKRDEQLATIEANYQRRLDEADTRYNDRQANIDEAYADYKAQLILTAKNILAAAVAVQDSDPDLAETIRDFALIYTVKSFKVLNNWYTQTSEYLVTVQDQEIATIEEIKAEREATVNSNFEEIKADAQAALQEAYSQCHNQGSGN